VLSPLALRPRLQSADFQQALATRPVARSAHFTVHFAVPSLARKGKAARAAALAASQLSTGQGEPLGEPVEECDLGSLSLAPSPMVWRLGLVVPKRMARRSVTRSLIKHQARELWRLHAPALLEAGWISPEQPVGNWVLRLKAPWPKTEFPSAASEPLKQLVRAELLAMLAHCAKGARKAVAS
jgi:ribonuclease P protein component